VKRRDVRKKVNKSESEERVRPAHSRIMRDCPGFWIVFKYGVIGLENLQEFKNRTRKSRSIRNYEEKGTFVQNVPNTGLGTEHRPQLDPLTIALMRDRKIGLGYQR